jgi:hypothetical protein
MDAGSLGAVEELLIAALAVAEGLEDLPAVAPAIGNVEHHAAAAFFFALEAVAAAEAEDVLEELELRSELGDDLADVIEAVDVEHGPVSFLACLLVVCRW